jgi:hypothetical protein
LNNDSQSKQAEYYNSLKQRADEACAWIISTDGFRVWLDDSNHAVPDPSLSSSKFCILFGDMGSGKSATTSFVVDYLRSYVVSSNPLNPFVCSYYCKNDNETNKTGNIYRSILWQLLTCMKQLRPMFMHWYDEKRSRNNSVDPTLDENALRDLLADVLQMFSQRIFLVLDGVDECDYKTSDHIFRLFKKLHEDGALVNVFLSCRNDEFLVKRLPPVGSILRMKASRDRDRIIATYHVKDLLEEQPENVKDFIVQELARQAQGSAIWLKMVLEFLRYPHRDANDIKRELKHLPSPENLSQLYRKLFETAEGGESKNATVIEYALETVAMSGRLLTIGELAYAVTLRMEGDRIFSLSDFEDHMIGSTGLRQLINPFVSFAGPTANPTVRIVHQSLKELIVGEAFAEWGTRKKITRENVEQRQAKLHSSLLECCIKYLLLDDLQTKDLFPEDKLEALERQEDGKTPLHISALCS